MPRATHRRASRVRVASYVLWIRLHTLLGASVCIEAVYERRRADTGVCARRSNLARNCRKETPRRREETRSTDETHPTGNSICSTRAGLAARKTVDLRKSDNRRMIGNERNRNSPTGSTRTMRTWRFPRSIVAIMKYARRLCKFVRYRDGPSYTAIIIVIRWEEYLQRVFL